MSDAAVILRVNNLNIVYQAAGQPRVHAVRGVSFEVNSGASLGIVGESGCGKSSLAKALIGLLRPSAGTISFNTMTPGRAVQMVFQDAAGSLNPRMTVGDTLAEALSVHRMRPRAEIPSRVTELLELVGLPQTLLHSYPREISGGQCQRVSFARCLALEPRMIIADEPVSALDVSVQARILNLVRELQKRLGLSIILISHDLAVVRNVCDRVAVMHAGVFVETGAADAVLTAPQHAYTRDLLAAVPDVARALQQRSTAPRQ